jgi:hypothetical protein
LHATTLHATATALHGTGLHAATATLHATATTTAALRHRRTATQRSNQRGNYQHVLAHDLLLSHERMNWLRIQYMPGI